MKIKLVFQGAILVLFVSLCFHALARPRPPGIPFPEFELKGWRFDIPDYVNAEGLGAHIATNIWLAESWSGYALDMRAPGSLLLTPAVVGPHRTNFTQGSGTIRLWYSPTAWASASAGGTGPGDWATLFELGQTNTVEHPFGFSLAIDPFGTNLFAAVNTETGAVTLVQSAISWSTGQWHQIAFVYDGTAVELFVDDNSDTISFTVPTWPSSSVWNQSAFSLGSGFDGSLLSMGQLDEIHTFGYALSTNYLAWTYQLYAPIAALGPLLDEIGGGMESLAGPAPCDPCSTNGGSSIAPYDPVLATNGFRFKMTPYVTNSNTGFYVMLLDTNPVNTAYEIYQTLNLGVLPSQTLWTLAATGAVGVTNFTLAYSTNTTNASFLAARRSNADADGYTDAYEALTLWGDADGDGLSDSYELAHGTNPNLFDSDTNGMGDNLFTLTWWIREDTVNFNEDLIRGDGFRVQWNSGVQFFLDQYYQDVPLRDWLDRQANAYFPQADWLPGGGTGGWHKWKVEYDYRRVRITHYAANGTTVLSTPTEWADNITERLGTNAATTVFTNSSATMSNVVVQHFVSPRKNHYVWEGVIGNTSDKHYGDSMHSPFWPMMKMVRAGTNLFYTCSYNEPNRPLQKFSSINPQVVLTNFGRNVQIADGDRGLLITNIVIETNALFAAGNMFFLTTRVANTTQDLLSNVQYYATGPTGVLHGLDQPTMTNAVITCYAESTRTLHGGLTSNTLYFIRVFNETNVTLHSNAMGALTNGFRVMLGANGLGTNYLRCTGLHWTFDANTCAPIATNNTYFPVEFNPTNLSPAVAASNRLAVSTNPVDGKIAVFDASSQQVKVYNANGTGVVFTIGVSNGYANGPSVPYPVTGNTNFASTVKLGGYYDDGGTRVRRATVCYQADGKLWVSDTATARMLRFNSDGSLDTFIETIPHSYYTSVDPNDTKRVFANFLEFRVDHSQPVKTCWALTNYWGYDFITTNGTRTNYVPYDPFGLKTVTTVTVGGTNRTFALMPRPWDTVNFPSQASYETHRLIELTSSGMKETLSDFLDFEYELDANGAVNSIDTSVPRVFQRRPLLFNGSGHAYFGAATNVGSAFSDTGFPEAFYYKIHGNNFILFDRSTFNTGFHLGAVPMTGSVSRAWAWRASPSGAMDGMGTFDTSATHGGQQMIVTGDDIFFVYEGEGSWRGGDGIANQIFHFKSDGRFVGQFGLPLGLKGNTPNPPGAPSNLFTVSAVRLGSTLYLYTGDEASRGDSSLARQPLVSTICFF
jgi:hypothetical protein